MNKWIKNLMYQLDLERVIPLIDRSFLQFYLIDLYKKRLDY